MKKRSLVAALAMLMVSAIVLTSSTYAWFATSDKAQVTGVQATVENGEGSILISATGEEGSFATSVNYADFKAASGNITPDTFTPVSYNPAGGTWIRGSIAQGTDEGNVTTFGKLVFNPQASNGGEYIKIKVYMKATAACTVNVSGTMNSAYNFVYACIHDDSKESGTEGSYKVYANNERSYTPVISATQGIDVDANSIMTGDDKLATDGSTSYNGLAGAPVTAKAVGNDLAVTFAAGEVKTVTVYVWAEGNDSACAGSLKQEACGVTLNFSK